MELRKEMVDLAGRRVILMDSISSVTDEDRGQIVVSSSHGGQSSAAYAMRHPPAAVFFNDAGVGKDEAGTQALRLLDERGVAAGVVSHQSARIGDARDTWLHGRLSYVNAAARAQGYAPGEPLKAAVERVLGTTSCVRRALLAAPRAIEIETVPAANVGPRDVRVRVDACGICGSDLHMYTGHHPVLQPPLVMGHEFVGRIVEAGPATRTLRVGDRVVSMAGRGCGQCEACHGGHANWCEELHVIGGHVPGGLADECVLPEDQLVVIPDWIPTEQAALIEVAAVGMHTIGRHGPVDGQSCLVLGAGPVGLLLARLLRACGAAHVVVSDVSPTRRDLAVSSADRVLDLNVAGAEDGLMRQFPRGLDAAFDCAGRAETLGQALRLTRRGASILLTAIFPEQVSIPMVQLQRAERQLIGVQLYQRGDFEAVLRLLENKRLDLSGVVTHAYPLERTADAFGLLLSPEAPAGKVLIRLDGGTLGA